MALPQNRQERNIISTTVSENLPDFVREDHPTFVKFVETYYEWLESKENSYFAPLSLNGVVDVDKTSEEFIKYFKTHTMSKFPENFKSVKGDTLDIKKVLKRIRSFYLAKGTESSIEYLIRLMFDVYVETYRPGEDIFTTSGGLWYAPTIVRSTDTNPTENAKIRGEVVEFIDGGNVIGTALVDDIHQFVMSGNSILELELVDISNFTTTDSTIIKFKSGEIEKLYSMVIDIPISSTGLFYTLDDPVTLKCITGTPGTDFKGSVEAINKTGGIRKIRIDEPGINYTSSGNHILSTGTKTGISTSLPLVTLGAGGGDKPPSTDDLISGSVKSMQFIINDPLGIRDQGSMTQEEWVDDFRNNSGSLTGGIIKDARDIFLNGTDRNGIVRNTYLNANTKGYVLLDIETPLNLGLSRFYSLTPENIELSTKFAEGIILRLNAWREVMPNAKFGVWRFGDGVDQSDNLLVNNPTQVEEHYETQVRLSGVTLDGVSLFESVDFLSPALYQELDRDVSIEGSKYDDDHSRIRAGERTDSVKKMCDLLREANGNQNMPVVPLMTRGYSPGFNETSFDVYDGPWSGELNAIEMHYLKDYASHFVFWYPENTANQNAMDEFDKVASTREPIKSYEVGMTDEQRLLLEVKKVNERSIGTPSYGQIFTKPGVYLNNDGKLSSTEFLQDNFRYQMHSYVIRTEASLHEYESVLKDLVHPAGKKVLGDYFVYRKNFGPTAEFIGYRQQQLFSPFFANYFPYGIATVSDGAFNASNNGQFGVLDSSIDLRGVCSGFIGSGQYSDAYYDFFPFGYDGATGYTLEFPSSQEQNTNPRTTFGTGISAGWDIQDFNKFGGVGATQEFFAKAGQFDIKIQEIQYYNRLAAQNRDHHLLNPFERGDIVAQLNEDGSERLRGIVYENSWSQNFGRFKVRILNNPNRNFKTASPSEQEVAFSTSSLLHKIKNITKNAVYTGGSNYTNQLTFFSSNVADGHDQDFFKVGDHIYQGTGASAQGQVLGWNPPVLDILVLTDNDNIDVHGTSFTGGISADCDGAAIMRIKGSGHGEPTLSSTTGSTFGGETYNPQLLPTLTTIRFLDFPGLSHDTSFFKNGDHIYQGTGGTGLTQAHGYVASWNPPYLSVLDITPLENWATGISLGFVPSAADSAADSLLCDKRLFRVKGSGHGGSALSLFSGSSFGGQVYTGGTQSFAYTDSSCPLDGGSFALGMFVVGVTKGARMSEGCGASVPIYRFLKTAGPNVEYQLGGVVDDVTTLVNEDSNTGSTLPGWPSNNTDFWIVHPHPNTWHGNITAGISWGAIPLQSFMKTPYKLTSPPEYGASGSVGGSINQNFNNNIPGGYGS